MQAENLIDMIPVPSFRHLHQFALCMILFLDSLRTCDFREAHVCDADRPPLPPVRRHTLPQTRRKLTGEPFHGTLVKFKSFFLSTFHCYFAGKVLLKPNIFRSEQKGTKLNCLKTQKSIGTYNLLRQSYSLSNLNPGPKHF
jgi:hypothetical protein